MGPHKVCGEAVGVTATAQVAGFFEKSLISDGCVVAEKHDLVFFRHEDYGPSFTDTETEGRRVLGECG